MARTSMFTKKNEKIMIVGILILAIILLTLPTLLRYMGGNTALIGEQAYFHSRIADMALEFHDSLILGERDIQLTPYHMLLGAVSKIMSIENASMFLPLLLGMCSLILFYFILKRLNIDLTSRFAILLVLILSPAFIYSFTVSTPHCLALTITLFGIFCFLQDKKAFYALSSFMFFLLTLFSIFNALMAILFLIAYKIMKKEKKAWIILLILGLMASSYLLSPGFFIHYEVTARSIIELWFSDLGAKIGFGIFGIFLFIAGLFYQWDHKRKLYPLYIITFLILGSAYFIKDGITIYINFLAAYFIGMAVIKIRKRKWELQLIKNLSLLIIVCGLLFSTISYANRLSEEAPSDPMLKSLDWLEQNSFEGEVVVSHFKNGAYIGNYKMPFIIDSFMYENKKTKRFNDVNRLFHTTDLDEAKQIIRDYDITYIFIDADMKEELWQENDDELLFLFRNKQTFEKIYNAEDVEIWKFVG